MEKKYYKKRKTAAKKRATILALGVLSVILALLLIVFIILSVKMEEPLSDVSMVDSKASSEVSESKTESESKAESSSKVVSADVPTPSQVVDTGKTTLDAEYSRLILVNGENPLPSDYDYGGNITTIPAKYLNGNRNKIDKDIYPYVVAMVEAAWADGVNLYVLSPYRSYSDQQVLFQNKVNRVINAGTPKENAEDEAATVVARPGTSEHHTGLAIDFNSVEESFEQTPQFRWLQENAEDYGFILRYPKDKTDITGVIYEPWHYRFVGINKAKEINRLGVTLEEYLSKN